MLRSRLIEPKWAQVVLEASMSTSIRIIDEHSDGSWGDGVAETFDLSRDEIRVRTWRRASWSSGVARLLVQLPERKKPVFVLAELMGSRESEVLRLKMLHTWPAERRLLESFLSDNADLAASGAYQHVPFTEAAAFAM
jgi:hypothetical protein